MVDTKITDLASATAASGDEIVINDITDTSDKKVTAGSILDILSGDITSDSSGVTTIGANAIDSDSYIDASIDSEHLAAAVFSTITGLGTQAQDMEFGGFNIQNGGVIFLKEQAEADADVAGEGQLWVDLATPNKIFFTDDAGTDFDLTSGSQTPVVADIDYDGFNMLDGGIIKLREQAEADADTAGAGQIWVDTATPNVLFFTDDAGTDFRLNFSTSAQILAVHTRKMILKWFFNNGGL